jgi:hypothetical protein
MVTPNDVLRFFLELATLAALAYWGFSEFGGVVQWSIGLGAALFAADSPVLAVIFAVLTGLHLALTFALGQRPEREAASVPPS